MSVSLLRRMIDSHQRAVAGAVGVLLAGNLLVAVRHVEERGSKVAGVTHSETDPGAQAGSPSARGASPGTPGAPGTATGAAGGRGVGVRPPQGPPPGTYIPGFGTVPQGINDREIRVVYYWKGDQAMNGSTYLQDTGVEGNVDEGEAFRNLVAYINRHPNGDATFMGYRYNLHGRRIVPIVEDAGKDSAISGMTEDIVKVHKPFAAISSHGSLSVYVCPTLAAAGIFNFGTYDLGGRGGTLAQRTNGYCVPQATSWEAQVDHAVAYLSKHRTTKYVDALGEHDRVYGFVYADYDGLVDVAPRVVERLRRAGINIPENAVIILDHSTTVAAQQAPNFVNQLRFANVNTIISPDAGAPISFTHAADANGYYPDWFVWPCSGQDSTGMVRLYNAHQWERASGLTCYDPEFNADLVNDDQAQRAEWYRQYQEVDRGEPPAPTPLVYQSLLPLLVGLTNAGPRVSVEGFRAGMERFEPYRYSAVRGRTTDPRHMLVTVGRQDLVGDIAKIRWDPRETPEGGLRGTYAYTETRRYVRGATY